jgi:RNA polymerase sigma factor (sigma-70 family)
MLEATFQQAYPLALRAAQSRATAAVRSGSANGADRDDLQQEGLTASWRALPQFDPSRASLRTFIERVVGSRLASFARSARQLPPHVPIEAARMQPVAPDSGQLDFNADLRRIASTLQSADRQLIFVLLEYSPAEASRLLGISRSTLYTRIARLRPHFAAAGYAPDGGRR